MSESFLAQGPPLLFFLSSFNSIQAKSKEEEEVFQSKAKRKKQATEATRKERKATQSS